MSSKMNYIPHISSYEDIRAEMSNDLQYRLASRTAKTSLGRPLYYRINVLSLTIPPLRERPQDISLLIRHFVQKYAKEFQRRIILDNACFDALHHHTWPGNVRELENTIIRLILQA